jgi:hypothetical protein
MDQLRADHTQAQSRMAAHHGAWQLQAMAGQLEQQKAELDKECEARLGQAAARAAEELEAAESVQSERLQQSEAVLQAEAAALGVEREAAEAEASLLAVLATTQLATWVPAAHEEGRLEAEVAAAEVAAKVRIDVGTQLAQRMHEIHADGLAAGRKAAEAAAALHTCEAVTAAERRVAGQAAATHEEGVRQGWSAASKASSSAAALVAVGLGRIVALCCRSSTLYHIY